jgi:hypothetical protein
MQYTEVRAFKSLYEYADLLESQKCLVALIIIDPITVYLGRVDSHKNTPRMRIGACSCRWGERQQRSRFAQGRDSRVMGSSLYPRDHDFPKAYTLKIAA